MFPAELECHPLAALIRRASSTPDDIVMTCGVRQWTAQELLADCDRAASGMVRLGLKRGDRVIVHMPNIAEAAISILACFRSGMIAVLFLNFQADQLVRAVQKTQPSLYLGHETLYAKFSPVDERLVSSGRRFVVGAAADLTGARDWNELASPEIDSFREPEPDAVAALLPTSGTTGESKLVVWSHRMFASLLPALITRGMQKGDVLPLIMPLMHCSGLTGMSGTLMLDGHLVLVSDLDPGATLDIVERHRATILVSLPYAFGKLAESQRDGPRNVSSLRVLTSGGDVVDDRVAREVLQHFGLPLESFLVATEEPGGFGPGTRLGPFTSALESSEVQLVDDDCRPVGPGETGELLVRSPTTASSYWEGPDDLQAFEGGFFRSGDLLREVSPGEFEYMGRKSDVMHRDGRTILPLAVEMALTSDPAISEAAVVGPGDDASGWTVGAVVVPTPNSSGDASRNLVEAMMQRLSADDRPDAWIIADAIPRQPSGKVNRSAVQSLLQTAAR